MDTTPWTTPARAAGSEGAMEVPAGQVVVQDQGLEGPLHPLDVAAEDDGGAPGADFLHLEPVLVEPGHHGVQVLLGGPEPGAEGFRGQPLVVERGAGILLLGQEGVQAGLGLRGDPERQDHPFHGHGRIGAAQRVRHGYRRRDVAVQHHPGQGFIDRGRGRGGGESRQQNADPAWLYSHGMLPGKGGEAPTGDPGAPGGSGSPGQAKLR